MIFFFNFIFKNTFFSYYSFLLFCYDEFFINARILNFVLVNFVRTGESARMLAEVGVDGILVSAHGGRQLDYLPAPVKTLLFSCL